MQFLWKVTNYLDDRFLFDELIKVVWNIRIRLVCCWALLPQGFSSIQYSCCVLTSQKIWRAHVATRTTRPASPPIIIEFHVEMSNLRTKQLLYLSFLYPVYFVDCYGPSTNLKHIHCYKMSDTSMPNLKSR